MASSTCASEWTGGGRREAQGGPAGRGASVEHVGQLSAASQRSRAMLHSDDVEPRARVCVMQLTEPRSSVRVAGSAAGVAKVVAEAGSAAGAQIRPRRVGCLHVVPAQHIQRVSARALHALKRAGMAVGKIALAGGIKPRATGAVHCRPADAVVADTAINAALTGCLFARGAAGLFAIVQKT